MLNNLQLSLNKLKEQAKKASQVQNNCEINAEIACNLVDILFKNVNQSIQQDRSSVKLNALAKATIGGVLGRTRDGTKEYISGMRGDDIKVLLDDLENELRKRHVVN